MDENNKLQGPFNSLEMDLWYRKGFFNKDLIVSFKKTELDGFFKLKDLLQTHSTPDHN